MKIKKIILVIITVFLSAPLLAQTTMNDVLAEIEKNNTTLAALRLQADADKLENKTDIFLEDPQLGFNLLWGNSDETPYRRDYNVSQTFDFATLSGSKKQLSNRKNELVEWEFLSSRMNIMLEAKKLLVDLVYYNILLAELNEHKKIATHIVTSQKTRLDAGECSILEYNDARLEQSSVETEIVEAEIERGDVLAQLTRLNGGIAVAENISQYSDTSLTDDFESWYAIAEVRNPVLAYVKKEVEVLNAEMKVRKREGLPSLSVGYMGEITPGELLHGVSLGISVPLWSNKNKVKQARAAVAAAEARSKDTKLQFYGQLQEQYQRVKGLQRAMNAYRTSLKCSTNTHYLHKALDAGKLSAVEYLVQITRYYELEFKAFNAEREYQKALAELKAVEL